jgi:membrane protease YdiL (CAAX protease family)
MRANISQADRSYTKGNIFWNEMQNRLRAGWRVLIQLILFFVLLIGSYILINIFSKSGLSIAIAELLSELFYLAGGLGLAWLMARFVDHRPFADFGFHLDRKWWLDLGFGLALGAFLMTGIFLSLKAAGWITAIVTATTKYDVSFFWAFLLKVVYLAIVAINEELAFRGYLLRNLAEGFSYQRIGARGAIISALLLSAMAFGLGHLANQDVTILSTLNLVVSGLVIGLSFLLTGELGISIGMHLTWNLFMGTVFGFPVSGAAPTTHLFSIQQTGSILWTGGAFGPEGGLIFFAWFFIGSGLLVLWIKWLRKQITLHTPLAVYTAEYKERFGRNISKEEKTV